MINFLSSWVKNLSLALIIVSILEMILPNSKTKKYIKMTMGIYILFTIINPFLGNNQKLDLTTLGEKKWTEETQITSTETINQESMNQRLKQIYQEQLQKDIDTKLQKKACLL